MEHLFIYITNYPNYDIFKSILLMVSEILY